MLYPLLHVQSVGPSSLEDLIYQAAPILPRDSIKFILKEIVPSDRIWIWVEGKQMKAVCWYIDAFDNFSQSAELAIFIPEEFIYLYDQVLREIIKTLPPTTKSCIEIPLWLQHSHEKTQLSRLGFKWAYNLYNMLRDNDSNIPSESEPHSDKLRWVTLNEEWMEKYRKTVCKAFEGIPGMLIVSDPKNFASMQDGFQNKPVLLIDRSNNIVGFYRIHLHEEGRGEISLIGRNPSYKGQGMGSVLMQESLRQLKQMGATTFSLEVAAINSGAIDLYETFGFTVQKTIEYYRSSLSVLNSSA